MINLKTESEIKTMAEGGKILATMMETLLDFASVGMTTLELDSLAENMCHQYNVVPSFKGFEGYQYSLVTCLNEEIVHGIPSERVVEDGDLLTLDFGIIHQGFHSDMARTKVVGKSDAQKNRLIEVGKQALNSAIDQAQPGNRIGDISFAMQHEIESAGFNVVRIFVGHGVGRHLHEDPEIPCFGEPQTGEVLRIGEVIAIEVMYMAGSYQVKILPDGWTAITKDKSLSSMFENTVAITSDGPRVLTQI